MNARNRIDGRSVVHFEQFVIFDRVDVTGGGELWMTAVALKGVSYTDQRVCEHVRESVCYSRRDTIKGPGHCPCVG